MRSLYTKTLATGAARAAQEHYYGRALPERSGVGEPPIGEEEWGFIRERDSFYLGTITESGWPYIQHRGGPKGFVKVVGEKTIGFADVFGNRQMISTGAVAMNPRVSLFFMDYVARERLKVIGHARVIDAKVDFPEKPLLETPGFKAERYFLVDVVGYDWNCPKYITPRYTAEQVEAVVGTLKARIAELEARSPVLPQSKCD
jgi:predicted pyridoxine 5'-phosphate oxidase superfamily flavin-nucleotide-binding protein